MQSTLESLEAALRDYNDLMDQVVVTWTPGPFDHPDDVFDYEFDQNFTWRENDI